MATYGSYNIGADIGANSTSASAGWVTLYTCPTGSYADVTAQIPNTSTGLRISSSSGYLVSLLSAPGTVQNIKLGPGSSIQWLPAGISGTAAVAGVRFDNA